METTQKSKKSRIGLLVFLLVLTGLFFLAIPRTRRIIFSGVNKAEVLWQKKGSIASHMVTTLHSLRGEKVEHPLNENYTISDFKPLPNHWLGDRGEFILVASPDLSYRDEARSSANIIGSLSYSQRVRAVETRQVTIDTGGTETWYLLLNERGTNVYGWVPEWGVAFKNQFTPRKEWSFGTTSFYKGQLFAMLRVKAGGYFTLDWKAKGNGLLLEGQSKGRLYEYDDLVWLKKAEYLGWEDFFTVDAVGNLQHEFRFRKDSLKVDAPSVE